MRYVAFGLFVFLLTSANAALHSEGGFKSHSHSPGHSHDYEMDQLHEHGHHHNQVQGHEDGYHRVKDTKPHAKELWMDTIGSVVGISVAPFVLLLLVPDLNKHRDFLKILLGFAAGGLLGDAFLHLIPHALSHTQGGVHTESDHHTHAHSHSLWDGNTHVFLCVIFGIFAFLFIDKSLRFLRGSHDHFHGVPAHENGDKKQKNAKLGDVKNNPSISNTSNKNKTKNKMGMSTDGYLNLAADFTHNFTDGIAISGSFLISRNVGYVTTLTVLIHELPHEIGDYAILVKSGCGVYRAMLLQLVTALGAVLGASLSLLVAGVGMSSNGPTYKFSLLSPERITTCLLPFTAGGFIYIALVSVLPDLLADQQMNERRHAAKRAGRIRQAAAELAGVVLGVAMMAAIGFFE